MLSVVEDRVIDQREWKFVFTISIIGAVLFGAIIVLVGFCVKRAWRSVSIHSNMNEDHTYHTYDEIGIIPYGAISNVRTSDTNGNQGQNLTNQHEAHLSNEVNEQSTDDNAIELNADFFNDDVPQHEVSDAHWQHMSVSTDETNPMNEELSSDHKSQISSDSNSESSHTVMEGNDGDGYENPYQIVLHDRQEGHHYTQITIGRTTSLSSTESNCEGQVFEKSLTKKAGYINLQF